MTGAVTFLFPTVLMGLSLLPIVWLLLRLLPPAPKRIRFPAIMLMRELEETEQPTKHTPWWLLLLRILALSAFIFAMADPITRTAESLRDYIMKKDIPVLLLIDNGWMSGQNWQKRQDMALRLVERVHRGGRNVIVVPTADRFQEADVIPAEAAKGLVRQMQSNPWPVHYDGIHEQVSKLTDSVDTFWLSNGYHSAMVDGKRNHKDSESYHLVRKLDEMGEVTLIDAGQDEFYPSLVRLLPVDKKDEMTLELRRLSEPDQSIPTTVVMYGENGYVLGQEKIMMPAGSQLATQSFPIDTERRNRLSYLKIQHSSHAGGVYMVDENWRFRPVGIAATEAMVDNQGYLNDIFYMVRALDPFVDLHVGSINDMLEEKKLAVVMLSDDYPITETERQKLHDWVKAGGMLMRFAGPNLAAKQGNDPLLPVDLRYGGRDFEGSLTWDVPQTLKSFSEQGPFHGLDINDSNTITVSKQVLAQPSLQLEDKIWVRLEDNTPLVTGRREGQGYVVLFHTTASPTWSDMSISGLFIEMLRRLVSLSVGVTGVEGQDTKLKSVKVLDGLGYFEVPDKAVEDIRNQEEFKIDAQHPPGFYGQGDAVKAFNLIDHTDLPDTRITESLPADVKILPFDEGVEFSYKPHLVILTFMLLMLDFVISLYLRGLFSPRLRQAAVVAAVVSCLWSAPAHAVSEKDAIKYTTETWLAYVVTGDRELDRTSKQGLEALRRLTTRRTSADIRGVVGVNPEIDVLTYFPIIYWPVSTAQTPLTGKARDNVREYMGSGGLILFDTRDTQYGIDHEKVDQGRGAQKLRAILNGMRIPALHPVPKVHALRRSFYLLDDFPGRYKGGELWIQKHPALDHDGVPSLMIGGNDWAAAWAKKDNGQAVYRIQKGGERQREMSYRFGVNMIMMALTGNYKVDQVHTQELLKRMGK